tara:strand:- start:626 stop:802 length:177 start_codon:yes stop_codon:yes gene_type:complete
MGILAFVILVGGIILLTKSGYYKKLDVFKENHPEVWIWINIVLFILVFGWPFFFFFFL